MQFRGTFSVEKVPLLFPARARAAHPTNWGDRTVFATLVTRYAMQ